MKTKHWKYEIVSKNPVVYFFSPCGDIKEATIIDCDFDKYVTFTYPDGQEDSYKWGYVFKSHSDTELAKKYYTEDGVDYCPNCINPWKMLLNNKNYNMYKKLKRKQREAKTEWFVAVGDDSYSTSKKFKTLIKSLNYLETLDEKEHDFIALGENNNQSCNLIEVEDGVLYTIDQGRKRNFYKNKYYTIKSRHVGKVKTYKQWRK